MLRVGACLSLSGAFAKFGAQAAGGLEAWRSLDGAADLVVEDDRSDPHALAAALRYVAPRCDVLLGPYSTRLMRTAGMVAAQEGWLVWNHGGAGDDVQAAHPGHVVSVLTPATRYAEPFLRRYMGGPREARLWIAHGRGSFGRQVAAGAVAVARRQGIATTCIGPGKPAPTGKSSPWDLLSAGTFEEDIETIRRARAGPRPPRLICAVAAGVHEFGETAARAEGVFGIGQWFPGEAGTPGLGPTEADFLTAYAASAGTVPDYPAVQATAAAVLAAHCARRAGGTSREMLWRAATELDTHTLFGRFRISPDGGVQLAHQSALIRWTPEGPVGV